MSNVDESNFSSFNSSDTATQVAFFFSSSAPTAVNKEANSKSDQIFYGLNIAVGILGVCANGLFFVLLCCDKKLRSNSCNVLILNQTAIVIFASVILASTYAVKLQGLYFANGWTKFYCRMFDNNSALATGLHGSTTCLMIISFERYMKICHSILHKNRFRPWMQTAALAFPWIYSAVITFPIPISTTDVANGRCMSSYYWPAVWVQLAYGVGTVVWKYMLPIGVFIGCYAKILAQMKVQGRIHANLTTNAGQNALNRSERNIVTMLLYVVVFYIVTYTPINVYYLLFNFNLASLANNVYSFFVSLSYLNMCANPTIYVVKYQLLGGIVTKLQRKERTTSTTGVD